MRTFFLGLGLVAASSLALPAVAAEKQHDAGDLKRVNVTAINAETRVVFWNKDIVKVEVEGAEFPENVHINASGGTLEINTGGPHAAVNVLIDDCEGDDCGKRGAGPHMMFIREGDGEAVELDLEELIENVGDKNVWVRKIDDEDGNVEIKEFTDDKGNRKVIVKRFKHGEDGEELEDIDVEALVEEAGKGHSDGERKVMIIKRGDGEKVHDVEDERVIVKRFKRGDGEGEGRRVEVKVGVRKQNVDEIESLTVYVPYKLRLTAKTVNGSLFLKDGDGSRADATTVNGELKVEDFKGKLSANTVGGPLNVSGVDGSVRARTVSGPLSLQRIAGDVEARTVSGAIELRDLGIEELTARTHSGAIDHRGALSDGGEYNVKTTSGRVTFYLPTKSSFNYDIDSFSGRVSGKDFKIPKSKGRIVGTVGKATSSSPTIKVKTLSGKVKFVGE